MHDRLDRQRMNEDAALAAALRALPAATPPHDGWPQLAERLARARRKRATLRLMLPAALAASVALAVWLPHARPVQAPPPRASQPPTAAASADAGLAALRTHSQRLQAWVRTLDREGAALDGNALATAVSLQDRIGLIDLQLSATRDRAASAALWQQRNSLLERLGLLLLQPYNVAVQTRGARADTMIL